MIWFKLSPFIFILYLIGAGLSTRFWTWILKIDSFVHDPEEVVWTNSVGTNYFCGSDNGMCTGCKNLFYVRFLSLTWILSIPIYSIYDSIKNIVKIGWNIVKLVQDPKLNHLES